jgi:hypothetical protein
MAIPSGVPDRSIAFAIEAALDAAAPFSLWLWREANSLGFQGMLASFRPSLAWLDAIHKSLWLKKIPPAYGLSGDWMETCA